MTRLSLLRRFCTALAAVVLLDCGPNGPASADTQLRVAASRDGPHVAVAVSDQGMGVSAEQLPRLFRKYAGPGDEDAKSGLRGSGLGLAICKGLVEAHGGRIRAESGGPGQGARFTFPAHSSAASASCPSG
ncbi:MAG: ATP-binding protein [Rhodospirillales bacterium]|nr:ATP-binding protein [Rhodospirillales bacterium]